jgi:hypothetical protein
MERIDRREGDPAAEGVGGKEEKDESEVVRGGLGMTRQ